MVRTGAAVLDATKPRRAIVRLSRAAGFPEPLPDVHGLAVRVPDAYGPRRHQDFLLVTSGERPLTRHLLLPTSGFLARGYSSLLPYRVGGSIVIVGAQPILDGGGGRSSLASLRRRRTAGLRFELSLAPPRSGWTGVATLQLGERLPDEETEGWRLDPSNTGGGIELAGLINKLRRPAYRGSQEGRGSTSR